MSMIMIIESKRIKSINASALLVSVCLILKKASCLIYFWITESKNRKEMFVKNYRVIALAFILHGYCFCAHRDFKQLLSDPNRDLNEYVWIPLQHLTMVEEAIPKRVEVLFEKRDVLNSSEQELLTLKALLKEKKEQDCRGHYKHSMCEVLCTEGCIFATITFLGSMLHPQGRDIEAEALKESRLRLQKVNDTLRQMQRKTKEKTD
jgi:hypothetical protein